MGEFPWLEAAKLGLAAAFLALSSVYDYKVREVPNGVWKFSIPIAVGLAAYGAYTSANSPLSILLTLLLIAVPAGLFMAVFYLGFYGGADAKALITLAILFPTRPTLTEGFLDYVMPAFSLTIFNNSLLLSVLSVFYAAVRNLSWQIRRGKSPLADYPSDSRLTKALAFLTCVKKRSSDLKPYETVAEILEKTGPDNEGVRRIKVFQRVAEQEYHLQGGLGRPALPEFVLTGVALPMIIFIALGFLTALVVGDLVLGLVALFSAPL